MLREDSPQKKPPRILLIHPEVRGYRIGLFDRLAKKFSCTFIFTSRAQEAAKYPATRSWHYLYLKAYPFIGYSDDFCPGIVSYLIRNRKNYDVVIFSCLFSFTTQIGLPLAKLLRKKVILWDETWLIPPTLLGRLAAVYLRLIVRTADAGVGAGTKAIELYQLLGMKRERCFRAPDCAEDLKDIINPVSVKGLAKKIGKNDDELIIGYLGRVVCYKALDTLIEAFCHDIRPKYPMAKLMIVGDGPFAPECRELLNRDGWERVIWINGGDDKIEPVSHIDFVHYLYLTDIFVLPGRFVKENVPAEAWGLLLNEAMSLSKPVVSTKSVAAAYDIIEEGKNGFMVEEDSSSSLSPAIDKLLKDDKLREDAGLRSRQKVMAEFNYERMVNGFVEATNFCLSKQ